MTGQDSFGPTEEVVFVLGPRGSHSPIEGHTSRWMSAYKDPVVRGPQAFYPEGPLELEPVNKRSGRRGAGEETVSQGLRSREALDMAPGVAGRFRGLCTWG